MAVSSLHGIRLLVPDVSTVNVSSLAIAAVACLLTFVGKRGMGVTLAACCLLGAAILLAGEGLVYRR